MLAGVARSFVGYSKSNAGLDEIAAALELELGAKIEDSVVAYREGARYVQRFEPLQLAAPEADALGSLREGGVYLITGGMGDLGLNLAAFLARQHKAKLVLVGRTPLPKNH